MVLCTAFAMEMPQLLQNTSDGIQIAVQYKIRINL
jgi:hypothetical protein